MKFQRFFINISLLACIMMALADSWMRPVASVLAEDDAPRAVVDLAEIYRRVSPSVVSIEVEIGLFDSASGTGFVVDEFGHIVTNAHVVEDAYAIAVEFQDGLQTSAELIGMDTLVDIAVIKVDVRPYRLKPVTFGDSDDLDIGQSVLAIGNPFGLEATLTTGIISGLKRELEFDDGSVLEGMIQTDAAIAPGSSGGPLLTLNGEVIGVNSAGFGGRFGGTNFGFAIPSNLVKQVSENMIVQHAEFGRIGIADPVSTPQPQFELPKATPTPVETVQLSPTRIVFETATPTDTPTATDTPTNTGTPTCSFAPTETFTPRNTATATSTATITPTSSFSPTASPTLVELCRGIVLNLNGISLRTRPTTRTGTPIVGYLPTGTVVSILKQQREERKPVGEIWYFVSLTVDEGEISGWIRHDTVVEDRARPCPPLP